MGRRVATDGGSDRPDWRVPAARCGLEVTLLALVTVYLYLHVGSPLLGGTLLVVGIAGSVGVVLWYANRLSLAWVRYASDLAERRRRERERRRRARRRREGTENDR